MGTKNNPSKFDCYAKAEPDEPMFVLLARDPQASALVRIWAANRFRITGDVEKMTEAIKCAEDMERWIEVNRPGKVREFLWKASK